MRPRRSATPFLGLRPTHMRQKGLAKLKLSHLLSIRNMVFTFAVFMSALLWSRQYGLVSSFDISATQIRTQFSHQASDLPSSHSSTAKSTERKEAHVKTELTTSIHSGISEPRSNTGLGDQSSSDIKSNRMKREEKGQEHAQNGRDQQTPYQSQEEHNLISKKHSDGQIRAMDKTSIQSKSNQNTKHVERENDEHHVASEMNNVGNGDGSQTHTIVSSSKEYRDESDSHLEHSVASESNSSDSHKGTDIASAPAIASPPPQAPETPLADILKFTPTTAINFMHFHKTGGVSFKTSLHKFYYEKYKKNGEKVRVQDACYSRKNQNADPSTPSFMMWRCDWDPIREMNESERNKLDFTFGHQFWGNGIGTLLNKRDVRSFTILRHPFDRKVSFFYHFFVREVGRREEDITFEEIRDFLLYDKLGIDADLGRDLGPNYMAGRLLSDGVQGYVGNSSFKYYDVEPHRKREVAEEALKLVRDYVFVGLQVESGAAKCMLKKVVELFNNVNYVDNSNLEVIDDGAEKLNSGSYSLGAKRIWGMFSDEERALFDRKEKVDLLIYEEGERLFKKHVKLFGCSDRIVAEKYMS